MKLILSIILLLLLSFGISGQTRKPVPSSKIKPNKILNAVLPKLSTKSICGNPKWAESVSYSGTIVKRILNKNEKSLGGFAIKDSKNRRTFINLDDDHIKRLNASAPREISEFLLLGKRIKVGVYQCCRLLYAYNIQPL